MKALKILVGLLLLYVGVVALFESMLGFFQPEGESTMIITTIDSNGKSHNRVLARLESGGELYAAANHWPRSWYRQALANPKVQVTVDDETGDYEAIPVQSEEHDRVNADRSLGLGFRILTGFPPRYFLRLEPR